MKFTTCIFAICALIQLNAQPNNYKPKDPDFFPISVATQSTWNAQSYKNVGINLYISLWNPLDAQQLSDLHKANMKVICTQNSFALNNLNDSIIYGWDIMDEPDNAQWNEAKKDYDPCVDPAVIIETYKSIRAKDSLRPVYLNLGQGVSWIEWYGRGSKCYRDIDSYKISKNGYIKGCDIISFDIYPVNSHDTATKNKLWMVPKGIDSLYSWGNNSKPAWCWIETTRISESGERKPTPNEVKAEVWMALIHGAKGIGYFCHSWYPSFVEYALLKDSIMLNAVKQINKEITSLARILNSENTLDFATVNSSNSKVPIDIMTKSDGTNYIFAVAMRNENTTATFNVKSGEKAIVIGENRTIDITNGKFIDSFNGFGVHLYQILSTNSLADDNINHNEFEILPNPAIDQISISLNNSFENSYSITISNNLGEIITKIVKTEPQSDIKISTQDFSSGFYYCTISNGKDSFTKRFIVIK